MEKTKKALNVVGRVVLTLFVIGLVSGFVQRINGVDTSTPQATANTYRNSFISGCKPEAAKKISDAESFCTCAYDKLLAMYPDFATNSDRFDRINTQGYNQTETDAVVVCLPSTQTN